MMKITITIISCVFSSQSDIVFFILTLNRNRNIVRKNMGLSELRDRQADLLVSRSKLQGEMERRKKFDEGVVYYFLFTISEGKSQPSVEVHGIEKVDAQFIKTKKEVDKTKILEQVIATGVIPDVST
jgi:hypothetical protein